VPPASAGEFTAIGRIAEGDAWQADDGDRHPWRRRVEFDESARPTPIAPLLDDRARHGRR
jgi:hypothetical protein